MNADSHFYSTFYASSTKTLNVNPSFKTNEKIRKTNLTLKEIIRKINSSAPKSRQGSIITTTKFMKKRTNKRSLVERQKFSHHKSIECGTAPHTKVHAYLTAVNSWSDIKPSIVSVPTHLLFTRSK